MKVGRSWNINAEGLSNASSVGVASSCGGKSDRSRCSVMSSKASSVNSGGSQIQMSSLEQRRVILEGVQKKLADRAARYLQDYAPSTFASLLFLFSSSKF